MPWGFYSSNCWLWVKNKTLTSAVGSEDSCNTQDDRLHPPFHKSPMSCVGREWALPQRKTKRGCGRRVITSTLALTIKQAALLPSP